MLIYAGLYATAMAIATLVLAASLFLVEDEKASSFKRYGAIFIFTRCAGICVGTTLGPVLIFADDPAPATATGFTKMPGVTPFWGILALVVWFGGVMVLFRKTPGQALLLFPINALFGLGIAGAIRFALIRLMMKGEGG